VLKFNEVQVERDTSYYIDERDDEHVRDRNDRNFHLSVLILIKITPDRTPIVVLKFNEVQVERDTSYYLDERDDEHVRDRNDRK